MLYVATLIAFLLAMLAMAIGVLLGRVRTLRRGCGVECPCSHARTSGANRSNCPRKELVP